MAIFNEFPQTNFHDINLDWIIAKVKELAEEWARYYTEWNNWQDSMIDDWEAYQNNLNAAWQSMQDYINNYFDNLDVQDEINNKIGDLIDNGTFQTIIQPYISPQVSAWLAANITQPTNPVIDASLTISGAAADAKITGDKIGNLEHQTQRGLYYIGEGKEIYIGFEWEVGTIQNGVDVYNAKTWRTKGYYKTSDVDFVETLLANQGGTVWYYTDDQGTYADAYTIFSSVPGTNMKESINKSYPYFRATLGENTFSYLPDLDYLIFYNIAPFKETIDIIQPKTTELETELNRVKAATVVETAQRDGVTLTTTPSKVIMTDGSVGDTNNQGFLVSDLVEIGDTTDYLEITAGAGWNHLLYAFYDENENFISGLNSGSSTLYITAEHVDIPEGAKYVRLAKAAASSLGLMKVTIVYQPAAGATAKWQGKKWTVVGDSLTAINLTTNKRYFDYIAEVTGITVVNMGDSGSGYMNEQDQGTAFYQRILNVPTDSDVVTIFGSFNDGYTNLGTKDDTGTDTIGGCINRTIDNLYSIMPTVQLGIVSPTPWIAANPYNHPEANGYADLLEAICKKRSIPFLNLYYESNLRPWNAEFRQLAYSKDNGNGVHPDETGHKIIASRFEGFLDSLLL